MQAEIEAKFLNVDLDTVREALKASGGELQQPMRLMKRALIEKDHHFENHSFIRIRDEGDKVTLTYKKRGHRDANRIDNTAEIEVDVSDFDKTVELFKEAGWEYKTFQESKRETWHLGDVEVVIDEWPWIEPMVEIEADSEEKVRQTAETLGFDWGDAMFSHIDAAYQTKYDFAPGFRGVIDLKEVRFGDPLPEQFLPKGDA